MELKLLQAIIEQAIYDAKRGNKEANDWLLGDEDFHYICTELGVDSNMVLKEIRKRVPLIEPVVERQPIEEDFWC